MAGRRAKLSLMTPRDATPADIDPLADLWHAGWRDAHLDLLPAEVAADRTLQSFRERLTANLARVRTIGDIAHPLGFTWIKGDELNQFYVAAEARGQGVAATLMADAEARMKATGVTKAWLDCAIGNLRAARFYEKSGWRRAGTVTIDVTLTTGTRPFEVWRYEKTPQG